MNYKLSILLIMITAITFTACKKEDTVIPNEEEVITTVTYTLTPVGGGAAVVFSYQDLDGDGGNPPVITNGTLAANTTYNGRLELLNELESPAGDISAEVLAEGDEHQIFFSNTTNGVSIIYKDQDADGNPIGLTSELTTIGTATGKLTITLRHEPAKTAGGVAAGDITNAGGETDIEVTFDLDVQ